MVPTLDDVKIVWPVVANFLHPPQSREDYDLLQARLDQLEHEAEEGSDLEILMEYLGELLDKYELAHFPEVAELDKEDV
ncbi:hypothetical protein KKA14_15600, partial [bacterium]|nr:hypothetical protein [bacterium]